jgi:hypothetical protein
MMTRRARAQTKAKAKAKAKAKPQTEAQQVRRTRANTSAALLYQDLTLLLASLATFLH